MSIAGVPRLAPPPLSLGIPGIPLPPHLQDSEAAGGSTSSWGLQVGSLPALSGGGLFRSGECPQAWLPGLPASKAPAHALLQPQKRRGVATSQPFVDPSAWRFRDLLAEP
jgi:hypothetical protein